MLFVALLLLIGLVVELYVIVQVAQAVGAPQTILALLLVGAVGTWLVKQQGLAVWRRFNQAVQGGRIPHLEIIDGAIVLSAGLLFLLPGFVSDVVAILVLLPPVRVRIRGGIVQRFTAVQLIDRAATRFDERDGSTSPGPRSSGADVWDAESWESGPDPDPGIGELGR